METKTDYSPLKKTLWRYLRTGLAAMLGILTVQVTSQDFKLDQALVSSLIAGTLAAIFKGLRDDLNDPSSTNVINKFPL